MNITLDDDVVSYVKRKKETSFTLNIRLTGGGWCGFIKIPETVLGAPVTSKGYKKKEVDGIIVYVDTVALSGTKNIRFKLKKSLFYKEIIAQGLKLG